MATVDILVPSYKGPPEQFRNCVMALMQRSRCTCGTHDPWKCDRGKHSIMWQPGVSSCVIHWSRNHMVAQSMWSQLIPGRPPAEWFLLLDDDILVEPHYLDRLLSHNLDVVYGICTKRRDPPEPTIRTWSAERGKFDNIVEWAWDSQKLITVDGAGAACALVRRSVFERVAEAYLSCKFERERDYKNVGAMPRDGGDPIGEYWNKTSEVRRTRHAKMLADGDWQGATCWWFEFMRDPSGHERGELGEDLSFSWKLMQLGIKQHADPQVLPGHLGDYAYSVRDFRYWRESEKHAGIIEKEEDVPACR